jgi:hypothetical protein
MLPKDSKFGGFWHLEFKRLQDMFLRERVNEVDRQPLWFRVAEISI